MTQKYNIFKIIIFETEKH